MKTNRIKTLVLASIIATSAASTPAFPQDQDPVPPPRRPPVPPKPDLKPMLDDVRRQLDLARDQGIEAISVGGDAIEPFLQRGEFDFFTRSGSRAARTLIVPAAEADAQAIASAEEDMNIMARVLDKALPGREGEKPERRAMGIPIMSSSSGAPIRNLLLDHYGAVFFLDVRFPLLPPEKQKEETKPKEEKSSAWEEARSELYSSRGPKKNIVMRWKESGRGEVEEYDEEKVQRLKDSLFDAFKHATHIRALKPDDSVTVIVTGGGVGPQDRMFVKELTGPDAERGERDRHVYSVNATGHMRIKSGQGGGTLAIRVKKSDIDAFTQSKLDPEQFKKNVMVRIY
jgi:hypothetical protein